jgi:hypothetical protein
MARWKRTIAILVVLVLALPALLFGTSMGREAQFLLGGALVNLGYRMQDHLESYDFEHDHEITPEQVWQKILKQNRLAASVRETFPRSTHHPLVALVACMDARIDTNELAGDTRRYYYVIRTAGSELSEREEDMLELAVENGVKLILLTTHSDCAAEKVAASPSLRQRFPALARGVDERSERIRELLARPAIAARVQAGSLAVKLVDIDTMTERMIPIPR